MMKKRRWMTYAISENGTRMMRYVRGHIFNAMSIELFDVYHSVITVKEL